MKGPVANSKLSGGWPPAVPDLELLSPIGMGSYGEVWLARTHTGSLRAVKIVRRDRFESPEPYDREYSGITAYEPVSRYHPGLISILHVGRNDAEGWFHYVMDPADPSTIECELGPDFEGTTAASQGVGNFGSSSDIPTLENKPMPAHKPCDPGRGMPDAKSGGTDKSSAIPKSAFPFSYPYVPHTLASELKIRSRLPIAKCIEIGAALADALHYLHERGLAHRDVKPANVIFVDGQPKLADPGTVKSKDDPGTLIGTEGFIPPERPGTPRGDIFSLGRLLYETANGLPACECPTAPPDVASWPDHGAWLELNEVICRACHLNPAERYASAAELRTDLLLLRSGNSLRRLRRLDQQFRRLKRVALLAAILVPLALSGYLHQQRQARRFYALSEESRGHLVRLNESNGLRAIEDGDLLGALPWLAEALRVDQGHPAREEIHRRRIAAVWRQSPRVIAMGVHGGPIHHAEWSRDEQWLVTASADGTAVVWEAATGKTMITLRHEGQVQYAAFSPDSRRVVTAGSDRTARVWDARTGEALLPPLTHTGTVWQAKFSPDGNWIATASEDHTARVWDARTGKPIGDPIRHTDEVVGVVFSPDGSRLATASHDGTARLWRVGTGAGGRAALGRNPPDGHQAFSLQGDRPNRIEAISPPLTHGDRIREVVFSPDGRFLGTASKDQTARIWDGETGAALSPPLQHSGAVWSVEFSPEGGRLVTGGGTDHRSGEVRVWRVPDGERMGKPLFHPLTVHRARFSPDGRWIATECADRVGRVWNITTGNPALPPMPRLAIWDVAFSADGRSLLTTSKNGSWRIWDLVTENSAQRILAHRWSAHHAEHNPAGTRIVTASGDGTARLLDSKTLQSIGDPLRHKGNGIEHARFSPDGRWVVTADDRDYRLWKGLSGALVMQLPGRHRAILDRYRTAFCPESQWLALLQPNVVELVDLRQNQTPPEAIPLPFDEVCFVSFSPDGKWIAAGGGDEHFQTRGWIQVFDTRTRQPAGPPRVESHFIRMMAFSPDGRAMVSAAVENSLKPCAVDLREVPGGQLLGPSYVHADSITHVAFAPEGKRLVTASVDRTAQVWNAADGQRLGRPLRHIGTVRVANFSRDGRFIVTASQDGTARVWEATTGHPLTPPLRHEMDVLWAEFSPDGERVLTASVDHTVRLWDISPALESPTALRDSIAPAAGALIGAEGEWEEQAPKQSAAAPAAEPHVQPGSGTGRVTNGVSPGVSPHY